MNLVMVWRRGVLALLLAVPSVTSSSQVERPFFMNSEIHPSNTLRFDFGSERRTRDWISVVDQVMGGRSTAKLTMHSAHISFVGRVSLENNGGFASLRSPEEDYDLSGYESVTIRYRAVGQHFALTLNQYQRFFQPRFKAVLAAADGQWHTETIRLGAFVKVRLGERLSGQLTSDELASTIRIGLISNDKVASEFELDVDYIEFK